MNIYFITIDRPLSYGDYISAIVFAESVDQARLIHPKGSIYDFKCDPDHADYEELDLTQLC